jgi:hypothetical protein
MATPRLLRNLTIEHRALECASSFEEVHRARIASLPALKPELSEFLKRGEKEKVACQRASLPKICCCAGRRAPSDTRA